MQKESIFVVINLLYECNNRCVFCCVDTHQTKKTIKPIEFNRVQHIFELYGKNRENCIQLAGGEPTLYDKLPEVFDLIRESAAHCVLRTNARIFSDFKYAALLLKNIELEIIIPFLSFSEQEFNRLTGSNKSFKETMLSIDNICKIKKHASRKITLGLTLYICHSTLSSNPQVVEQIQKRWPELDYLEFTPIRITTNICREHEAVLDYSLDELYESLNNSLQKIHAKKIPASVGFNTIPICLIDDRFLYMLYKYNSFPKKANVNPKLYFYDGRFNNDNSNQPIQVDPATCGGDYQEENLISCPDPDFKNICEVCIFNSLCNYRISPSKIPQTDKVKQKIISFNSLETVTKIKRTRKPLNNFTRFLLKQLTKVIRVEAS